MTYYLDIEHIIIYLLHKNNYSSFHNFAFKLGCDESKIP